MENQRIQITGSSEDYQLLDSGDGEKLERFGRYCLSRPDPQALWRKQLSPDIWKKSDGRFTRDQKGGDWVMGKNVEAKWPISFGNLKFWIKPTSFKHVGIFPEQAPNWDWLREIISQKIKSLGDISDEQRPEILNLFAYTGGATLACAQAGAKVVHLDGSKTAITWARENAELSGLEQKPIRWILDDARTFVAREIKRGRKYDGIIMDPPAFGHGPENELWKIEDDFLPLIESCFELLSDKPLFFLINGYASGYSAIAYENTLMKLSAKYGGHIEGGELAIEESQTRGQSQKDKQETVAQSPRKLPCGIFARWSGL